MNLPYNITTKLNIMDSKLNSLLNKFKANNSLDLQLFNNNIFNTPISTDTHKPLGIGAYYKQFKPTQKLKQSSKSKKRYFNVSQLPNGWSYRNSQPRDPTAYSRRYFISPNGIIFSSWKKAQQHINKHS